MTIPHLSGFFDEVAALEVSTRYLGCFFSSSIHLGYRFRWPKSLPLAEKRYLQARNPVRVVYPSFLFSSISLPFKRFIYMIYMGMVSVFFFVFIYPSWLANPTGSLCMICNWFFLCYPSSFSVRSTLQQSRNRLFSPLCICISVNGNDTAWFCLQFHLDFF